METLIPLMGIGTRVSSSLCSRISPAVPVGVFTQSLHGQARALLFRDVFQSLCSESRLPLIRLTMGTTVAILEQVSHPRDPDLDHDSTALPCLALVCKQ